MILEAEVEVLGDTLLEEVSGNGSGRRGPTPPNVDEFIKNFQDKIKKIFQVVFRGGGKPIVLGLVVF